MPTVQFGAVAAKSNSRLLAQKFRCFAIAAPIGLLLVIDSQYAGRPANSSTGANEFMYMLFKPIPQRAGGRVRRTPWRRAAVLLVACLATFVRPPLARSYPSASQEASRLRSWGKSVIKTSMSVFRLPRATFLSERAVPVDGRTRYRARPQPAFAWTQSMMVLMLAAAARCDARYDPLLWNYTHTLGAYWRVGHGVGGFDVLPGKVPLDRYYDDNEWMTWGFLRAYAATHKAAYLSVARRDFEFVLSGRSNRLGGGIYWHEQKKTSKNTCSNAPAIIDALKLYSDTGDRRYLAIARKLYRWLNAHLLDRKDYLYFDHIDLNGKINRTTWSYNAGAMLIANVLFYRITHAAVYLRRARRIARAAQKRWVDSATGGIKDPGFFAWVLLDGYEQLYKIDHNKRWQNIAIRALNYVHTHCINSRGLNAAQWDRPVHAIKPAKLINQACVGGAYLSLAASIK